MYKKQLLKLLFCPLLLSLMSIAAFSTNRYQLPVKLLIKKAMPLPGANHYRKRELSKGTNSDINGNYSVTVASSSNDVLTFSSIGLTKGRKSQLKGRRVINVTHCKTAMRLLK